MSPVLDRPPERIRCEIAVIGTGPGGSITASLLAEAGRSVVLVEEGPFLPLGSCRPFSRDEMVQKYRCGGVTVATGRPRIAYVEGRCVGGGSEINSGLYHRTPPAVLEAWRTAFEVEALTERDLAPHFHACEEALGVTPPAGELPAPSRKLHEGAAALGWRSREAARALRGATEGAPGVRQSMTETFMPRALAAGCTLIPGTRVIRLREREGGWTAVAVHGGRGRIEIEAETVFVCAGAVQTPALLRRSGITRNVGDALGMHPTVKVLARFPDEVNGPDLGVAAHQVNEFAPRVSFGCSISTRPYLAVAMLDHPAEAAEVDASWRRTAAYYAMITAGSGSVRPLPWLADPLVRYRLTAAELAELRTGLVNLCRCLLAAGAERLYPSIAGAPVVTDERGLATLAADVSPSRLTLMAVHLFASCRMGEKRAVCAVDSFGRVHGFRNLRVADASLLCGFPGVNPQGSIMALAHRNARQFLAEPSGSAAGRA
jgi:choline dehydrogenase-like flavoprotein